MVGPIRYRAVPAIHRIRGAGWHVQRSINDGAWKALQTGRHPHHFGSLRELKDAIRGATQADHAACTRLGLSATIEFPGTDLEPEALVTIARIPMPIPIERDLHPEYPYERCCFCRTPSCFWTTLPDRKPGAQVACCEACAKEHQASEVPTKEAWCESERAKSPRY